MFSKKKKNEKEALSLDKGSGCSGCSATLFGGLFICAGVFGLACLYYEPVSTYLSLQSWEETPCTITRSRIKKPQNRPYVNIHFKYTYENKKYTSTKYTYHLVRYSQAKANEIINAYAVGAKTKCYVNPKNPAKAVLNREFTDNTSDVFQLYILFIIVGCCIMVFGTLTASSPTTEEEYPEEADDNTIRHKYTSGENRILESEASDLEQNIINPDEKVVLVSNNSPLLLFIGLMIFGLIWNGIISVFVWEIAADMLKGKFEILKSLFLTPFLCVGVGIILGAIYYLLASFNPTPKVTIIPSATPVGGVSTISWKFEKSATCFRKFKIILAGEESATYQQGTSSTTEKHIFYSRVLIETDDSDFIQSGDCNLEIPPNTVPTWEGGNNAINWKILIQGDIPRWPDLNDEYEISVLSSENFVYGDTLQDNKSESDDTYGGDYT